MFFTKRKSIAAVSPAEDRNHSSLTKSASSLFSFFFPKKEVRPFTEADSQRIQEQIRRGEATFLAGLLSQDEAVNFFSHSSQGSNKQAGFSSSTRFTKGQ